MNIPKFNPFKINNIKIPIEELIDEHTAKNERNKIVP